MKLKHVDEGYFKHLGTAIVFAISAITAGIVLLIHAIFPFSFQNTASKILLWILKYNFARSKKSFNHIQIRYNTNSKDGILPWRVIIDGNERLAQDIIIIGNSYGEKTYVEKVAKYNLAVDGIAIWHDNAATIISKEK